MKKILIVLVLAFGFQSLAHDGHAHGAPKGVQAPKGGMIRKLEESMVEVVAKAKDLKIYFYDHDLKPQEVSRFTFEAKAQLPRVKKFEPVVLESKGSHLEALFDAKKAHRYTLILTIKDSKTGHTDDLKYVIEPKK